MPGYSVAQQTESASPTHAANPVTPQASQPYGNSARAEDVAGTAGAFMSLTPLLDLILSGNNAANEAKATATKQRVLADPKGVDALSDEDFDQMIRDLPEGDTDGMDVLVGKIKDPSRKLQLWSRVHRERALKDAKDAKGDDDAANAGRDRAATATQSEVLAEVEMLQNNSPEGLDMKDVDALIARKEREHQLEMKHAIDLGSDMKEKWTSENLEKLDAELDRMPAEHKHMVKTLRRETKVPGLGGLCEADGTVHLYSDNPATWVHEMAHAVDFAESDATDRFKEAVGFEDYGQDGTEGMVADMMREGLDEEAARNKLSELMNQPKEGAFGQQSVVVGGKVFSMKMGMRKDGTLGITQMQAYNKHAIPMRGQAEKTSSGWQDEWDFARTKDAGHFFTDMYVVASRDPVRAYSDFVGRPAKRREELEAQVEADKRAGITPSPAQADLEDARLAEEQLYKQWQVMTTEVFKVDEQAVETAAAAVPDDKVDAFREQSERCATPKQLADLRDAYINGTQVDASAIAKAGAGIPPAQRAAFEADAEGCFTPRQLEKLREAYALGKRRNGEWVPGKLGKNGAEDHRLDD